VNSEASSQMGLGRARPPEAAEKPTNACSTVEERRFSVA